jgi:hypothetical protein
MKPLTTLSICHHKNFDRYFEQTIQDGDISAEEFDELIEFLPNQAKTYSRLCDFHQRGILLSVLERLLACVDNFDSGVLTPLLTVILLGGSTKQRQQQAIETARDRWADYRRRKGTRT